MKKKGSTNTTLLTAFLLALSLLWASSAGCGGGDSGSTTGYSGISASSLSSPSVPQNITGIMTFDRVASLPAGTILRIRLNRTGTTVKEFDATFNGVDVSNNERLILCHVEDSTVIAKGDSGSPLLDSDGTKVAGALCYGYSGDSQLFAARAIEDVLAIDKSAGRTPRNTVTGIRKDRFIPMEPLKIISSPHKERTQEWFGSDFIVTENNAIPEARDAVTPVNGNSIYVYVVSGDLVSAGIIGTITYIDGADIYGFGHSLGRTGSGIAMPSYLARMITIVNDASGQNIYKKLAPTTQILGSLVSDQHDGALIRNASSLTAPVTTMVTYNSVAASYAHQLTQFKGNEMAYISPVHASCMDASTDYTLTGGTAAFTFSMKQVSNSEYTCTGTASSDSDIVSAVNTEIKSRITDNTKAGVSLESSSLDVTITTAP